MGKLCDKTLTRQKQEKHMFKDSMENTWHALPSIKSCVHQERS